MEENGYSIKRVLFRHAGVDMHSVFRELETIKKPKENLMGEGGMDWEFGISRCKLLYIGWINKKVLLYSTGDDIQDPVINHNGKEYEKIQEKGGGWNSETTEKIYLFMQKYPLKPLCALLKIK